MAGSSFGFFVVIDNGGSDIIDASAVTSTPIVYYAGAGADTFIGGQGNDAVFFAPANLSSADTIQGGTGIDAFSFNAAGTAAASAFTSVTGFEILNLSSAGNNVTLNNGFAASSSTGYLAITDGGGNDTVNASAVSATTIVFFAGAGADTFTGGSGNDAFFVAATDLNAVDTFQGGLGIDNLYFTTGGTVGPAALTNVTGVEALVLNGAGNSVILTNAVVGGSDNGALVVADGAGNDSVDASGVTNGGTIAFLASGGADTFRGGNGTNIYSFAPTDLTSADTVQGGAIDILLLNTAGTLAASAFTNVTGIETLSLANGTNNVTLTDGLVGGSSFGFFVVRDGTGNDTVDGSGVTGTAIAFFGTNGGNETFTGGGGNDSFLFAGGQLTAADTVAGGGGLDTLWMTTAGTTNTADLAGVSGIEGVFLQNGGTFNLANGITAAATLAATGTAAVDTFDASAVTGYGVIFTGNGGADVLLGGNQDDTFRIADSAFATIDGNGGTTDRIRLTAASQVFDLTANAAKVSDIEVIDLSSASAATLNLLGTDIAQVNAGTNSLYVVGDADDIVNAGTGYTLIASGVANAAVAPGHLFFEYQHSNGSHLFIDSQIADTTVSSGSASVPENVAAGATVFAGGITVDPGVTVTYSLGGADAALFSINSSGNVSFNSSPDFENAADAGADNVYDIIITAAPDNAHPNTNKTVTLTVTNVNDAPVNAVPGTQGVDEEATLTFSSLNGNAITISDQDVGAGDLTVTLSVAGGALTLNGTAGLAFGFGDGTANSTMTFSGSLAAINAALDGLTYTGGTDLSGLDALNVSTDDNGNTGPGGPQSDFDGIQITVAPVNDAPINSVPGPQTVNEDTNLVFSGANKISITDVDVDPGDATVTLSVAGGALTLSGTAGLAFTVGDGTGNSTMIFSGTRAAINAALDGLGYQGDPNFYGPDTLNITTNDGGNTGSGGAQSDFDAVAIDVTAVNDAPSFTVGGDQTVLEEFRRAHGQRIHRRLLVRPRQRRRPGRRLPHL